MLIGDVSEKGAGAPGGDSPDDPLAYQNRKLRKN